ncbi:MAG: mannitol dehydrogenase family protein [Acetobacter sp.]
MFLNHAALSCLPAPVRRPAFDPARLSTGIVHLGCGNFHRAHQAVATQAAIDAEGDAGLKWGITAATMRRPGLARHLRAQDNLYTLLTRKPQGSSASVIGSIHESIFAGDDAVGLPERIAIPQTRIVTLTVTASGYHLKPNGRLNPQADAIRADLNAERPRTAVGILTAGLARVRENGGTPPVILSCDNVTENGATLRQSVLDFAALQGHDALAAWIERNVQFPNTMVDRIAPTTTARDKADARHLLGGLEDKVPVSAEPWFQWIIGPFDGPRPAWEAHAGTRFVSDVSVFERAKLQMLNGSHMLLGYVGALAGLDTVAAATRDPALAELTTRFIRDEQSAGVALSADELDSYTQSLMTLFRNPSIVHEAARIGRNGSVKMTDRVMAPLRANLLAGRPAPGATLLIAAWIRCCALQEQGAPGMTLTDPHLETLQRACAATRDNPEAQARTFLAMQNVFGPALPDHDRQVQAVASMLHQLSQDNLPAFLRRLAA